MLTMTMMLATLPRSLLTDEPQRKDTHDGDDRDDDDEDDCRYDMKMRLERRRADSASTRRVTIER